MTVLYIYLLFSTLFGVTHHWHRLSSAQSSRPRCSTELMKLYHSVSVTV